MNNLADVIRLPAPVLEKSDLVPLLHKTLQLMEPFCVQHAVRLETHIPGQPLVLPLDAIQIEQLLVNVIRNAVESIGHDGEIKVILDPQQRVLRIEDTGNGIAHRHGFSTSLENLTCGGAVFRMGLGDSAQFSDQ